MKLPPEDEIDKLISAALSYGYHAAKDESIGYPSNGYGTRFRKFHKDRIEALNKPLADKEAEIARLKQVVVSSTNLDFNIISRLSDELAQLREVADEMADGLRQLKTKIIRDFYPETVKQITEILTRYAEIKRTEKRTE